MDWSENFRWTKYAPFLASPICIRQAQKGDKTPKKRIEAFPLGSARPHALRVCYPFLPNKTLSCNRAITLVHHFKYLLWQNRTMEIIHSPDSHSLPRSSLTTLPKIVSSSFIFIFKPSVKYTLKQNSYIETYRNHKALLKLLELQHIQSSLLDPTCWWQDWTAEKGGKEERKPFPSKRISLWFLILHPDQVLRLGPTSYMFLHQEAPDFLFFPIPFYFLNYIFFIFVVLQRLSCVWLFATLRTAALQAPLSSTISQSLLKFISIELVMPSHHLILCHPFSFAFNLSQHQGLFQWVNSLHQV